MASKAYLILFIDHGTRQVVKAQTASAFPVTQARLGSVSQVCALQFIADNYERAQRKLRDTVNTPEWSWLKPLMAA